MGRKTYFSAFSACQEDTLDDTDDSPCLGDQEKRMDSCDSMRKTAKTVCYNLGQNQKHICFQQNEMEQQTPIPPISRVKSRESQNEPFPSLI